MPSIGIIKIVIGILIISSMSGGWYYFSSLKDSLATSESNNIILQSALLSQKNTIDSLQKDIDSIMKINTSLTDISSSQQKEIDNLNNKFNIKANGTRRDFGAISRAKPRLINKIINKATLNVGRCFELATGAPIKKGEKNNECKELINHLSNN